MLGFPSVPLTGVCSRDDLATACSPPQTPDLTLSLFRGSILQAKQGLFPKIIAGDDAGDALGTPLQENLLPRGVYNMHLTPVQ